MPRRIFGRASPCTLLLSLLACAGDGEVVDGIQVVTADSAGVAIVTISGDVSALPEWTLAAQPVAVIGDEPPLLGRVGEVALLADGRILVEDEQAAELHSFDPSGAHVRRVGGRGQGPGEFQNLTELSLAPGDTAYTYDRRQYRISAFDSDGNLIRTLDVGRERAGPSSLVLDAWALDSEHFVLHSNGPGSTPPADGAAHRDQRDAVLHSLSADGVERRPPIRFTGGYSIRSSFGDATAPFANRPFVDVSAGRILSGSGLSYELVIRDADLEPRRIVRWSGWEQALTQTMVSSLRDSVSAGFEQARVANPDIDFSRLLEDLFRPDLLPELLPAVGAAVLDDDGRVWVARFFLNADLWKQEDVWHVLDSEGVPLARVPLVPSSRLAAVRGDRIALIVRDSLDVEQVQVFRLESGR
jgi:YD repeat-containing protein